MKAPQPPEPRLAPASELSLVERCLREPRDARAWEDLVQQYRVVVVRAAQFALARQGVRDAALAEDTASEVFAHLVTNARALASFEGRSSLATWLAVLGRREAARVLKRRHATGREGDVLDSAGTEAPPLEHAVREETAAAVRSGLDQLPARDRLALSLFYRSGCSYEEVARIVGLPKPQVSSLLARARARLSQTLAKYL